MGPAFLFLFFFFNDTATTEIYTLSLHDALPILGGCRDDACVPQTKVFQGAKHRSEEHTSELQSRSDLVCRLLLEKKKKKEKGFMLEEERNKQNQDKKVIKQ